jgi:hypothetical protein
MSAILLQQWPCAHTPITSDLAKLNFLFEIKLLAPLGPEILWFEKRSSHRRERTIVMGRKLCFWGFISFRRSIFLHQTMACMGKQRFLEYSTWYSLMNNLPLEARRSYSHCHIQMFLSWNIFIILLSCRNTNFSLNMK